MCIRDRNIQIQDNGSDLLKSQNFYGSSNPKDFIKAEDENLSESNSLKVKNVSENPYMIMNATVQKDKDLEHTDENQSEQTLKL